jgi:uncharacterized protein YndB with AHSA1/START domain
VTNEVVVEAISNQSAEATLSRVDDRWVLTMTRQIAHPAADVWAMLTRPERLVEWSPLVPDRPLTITGPATSRETADAPAIAVEVLVSTAPSELVLNWGDDRLRWTLTPTATGTTLTLEHHFAERDEAGSYAAGWHLCLAVLGSRLSGDDVERVVGERAIDYGWADLRDRYQATL